MSSSRHVLAWALLVYPAAALLTAGRMELCEADGVSDPTCHNRMIFTASVQNNQDATDSVQAFNFDTALAEDGSEYVLEDYLSLTLSKSAVSLRYPLNAVRVVNNKPYELLRSTDGGGNPYHWLFNRCQDAPDRLDGACGAYVDSTTAAPVAYSQGFCCRCDVGQLLGLETGITRAGMDCNFLGSSESMSAHCLRFDPLWYTMYELAPPIVTYTITAQIQRCADGVLQNCETETVFLSPENPGACVTFEGDDTDDLPCAVTINLEGDFAAFESPPTFESKYMFAPAFCDRMGECGEKLLGPAEEWMLVDRHRVTDGSECNKVGVSFEAFYSQGQRCDKVLGSCLDNQLDDFFQHDRAQEAAGQVGSYFLRSFGSVAHNNRATLREASVSFVTTRFQKTLVSVVVAADSLRHTLNRAPANIRAVTISPFESLSKHGNMEVRVVNTGAVQALFTVAVLCTDGIAPVPAQQLTLGAAGTPDAEAALSFRLEAERLEGAFYQCFVSILDSFNAQVDSHLANVTTTAVKVTKGSQGGELDPDAPTTSDEPGDGSSTCDESCPSAINVFCALANPFRCISRLARTAGIVAGVLVFAALSKAFPGVFCAPCDLLLRVCRRGREAPASPRDAYRPRRRRHRRARSPPERGRGRAKRSRSPRSSHHSAASTDGSRSDSPDRLESRV